MEILAGLAAVLAIALLGGAVVRAVGIGRDRAGDALGRAGVALLAGAPALALVALGALALGPRPSAAALAVGVVALLAALLARRRRGTAARDAVSLPAGAPPHPPLERLAFAVAVALAVLVTLDRALVANAEAIVVGDEAFLWAARARVAFEAGLGARFGELARPPLVWHPDYPALNPLLQAAVYGFAGDVTYAASRLPIQAQALALVLLAASALRRVARPGLAALLLVVGVATAEMRARGATAMADVMVAAGLFAAVDGWMRRDLALAALGLGYAAWSKNEGALHVAAFLAAVGIARALRLDAARPARALLGLALAPGAVLAATWAFNRLHGLENDLVSGASLEGVLGAVDHRGDGSPRWLALGRFLLRDVLLGWTTTRLLLALPLVLLATRARALLRGELAAPGLALVLIGLGYTAVYLWTPHDLVGHWDTSGVRVFSHLVPAATLWTAAALARLSPRLAARPSAP